MLKKTGRRPVGTPPCGEMGVALRRKPSAGHQHFWRPVGMVSARNALGLEIQQFEKELEDRDHIAEIL